MFSIACALFHFPYPVTSLFATLTRTAGVCTNNSQTGTRYSPISTRHRTQALSFHTLAHSFAPREMPTPLFSSIPALFAQNRGVGSTFLRIRRGMRTPRSEAPRGLSNFVQRATHFVFRPSQHSPDFQLESISQTSRGRARLQPCRKAPERQGF